MHLQCFYNYRATITTPSLLPPLMCGSLCICYKYRNQLPSHRFHKWQSSDCLDLKVISVTLGVSGFNFDNLVLSGIIIADRTGVYSIIIVGVFLFSSVYHNYLCPGLRALPLYPLLLY